MSAGTAVVMVLVAWLGLARGGVVGSGPLSDAVVFWGCWVVVGLMALNTVGNLMSTHPVERWLMGSTTAALVVLVGIVGWFGG